MEVFAMALKGAVKAEPLVEIVFVEESAELVQGLTHQILLRIKTF